MGIADFCLSFVEGWEDVHEAEKAFFENPDVDPANPVKFWLKIESPKGFDFVSGFSEEQNRRYGIIAARDDWFVTIGEDKSRILGMLSKLATICHPDTVLASRLFSGLERDGQVSLADYSDLELMRWFGYRHFMLSDGICQRYFLEAVKAWQECQQTTRFKD
jgi:hypothetical protein